MKRIPIALIYSRIFIGIAILLLACYKPQYYIANIIGLIITGLLTDIFDGIIARHLKISTTKMRRLDSNIDMVFWICVIVASYILAPEFYHHNLVELVILISLELACYILSYIKFKKEVATHALSAKAWALLLFATLIQVIASGSSCALFIVCFYWGIISRLEIIAILIVIKKWTNDVPTIYHAFKIKKGKEIKRLKLFNG